MRIPDKHTSRVETVLAALLYLMTAYHRTRCPRIAACVAAHLDCLADHPGADATIREVCAGMRTEWWGTATSTPRPHVH